MNGRILAVISYNIIQRECTVELHMHHAVEEYLIFTGAGDYDFFNFDAEVEPTGRRPEHMTYTITEPTVIRILPKLWHGPVTFKRVGAPINFMPFILPATMGVLFARLKPTVARFIFTKELICLNKRDSGLHSLGLLFGKTVFEFF